MKSLRFQLVTAIAIVLGFGLGTLLVMTGSQMANMTMEAFTNRQEFVTLAVASGLSETLQGLYRGRVDAVTFQQAIASSAGELNIELNIMSPDGKVVVTTGDQAATIAMTSPELASALSGHVTSEVRDNRLYAAAPVLHDNRDLVGVVQVDASLAPLEAELQRRWLVLIGTTAGTLIVACAIGWLLAGRIVRPLAAIRTVAQAMAGGKLNVRANISVTSSELVSLGTAFNEMAERIEVMMLRQQEFVANASHELRAPLAAIKLRTEALVDGSASGERAHQYMEEIDQEITQLGQLVSDLLALSRIESHSFVEPTEAINVADELNNSIHTIQPRLAARRQHFELAIDDAIPPLYVYPNDLRLMVSNLLDNSVKYTAEGGEIRLAASWSDSTLTVEICDNGEGIPPADLPRVVERFFRVDRAHHTPGTGLGLTIVLATARQYDGDLVMRSKGIPGEGTCACLTLRPRY